MMWALARSPDPNLALRALERLAEAAATVAASARARTRGVASTGTSPGPTAWAVSASGTVKGEEKNVLERSQKK